jgi:DNA-binding PadR family transcriptional regulator
MVKRGRIYAWAGESQYYVEPKRLAELGYLRARRAPGKTRERLVYTLTEKGLEALREWARTPVQFPRIRHEAVVRLLAADLVGEEAVRESLLALREEIAELRLLLSEGEAAAESLPHRRKYLLLNQRYAHGLLDLNLRWLEEVERELGAG